MSVHFDSVQDMRKHFESDVGSYQSQDFSDTPKGPMWFSETLWEYQAVRKYLNDQGMTGPLIKTCFGWEYTQ